MTDKRWTDDGKPVPYPTGEVEKPEHDVEASPRAHQLVEELGLDAEWANQYDRRRSA